MLSKKEESNAMNFLAYISAEIPEWANWFLSLSYFGVFLLSLVGAMSIFIPIPYTIVIFWLGASSQWDPFLLTIAGGLGAAIGELSGYVLGYYGRKIVSQERLRKMSFLIKAFGRYLPMVIFLFAFTPLPDDLLFIPLGILKYRLYKAFIPSLLGKFIMCYTLAYLGKIGADVILLIFGEEGSWIGSVILFALLIIVLVILFKVDWEKVLGKYVKVGALKNESNCRSSHT